MKENVPHRLPHLNTWSPVVGAVWAGVEVRRYGLAEGSLSLVLEL